MLAFIVRLFCLILIVSPSLAFIFFPIVSASPLLALALGPSVASTATAYVTYQSLGWAVFLYATMMRIARVWAGQVIVQAVESRRQGAVLDSQLPIRGAATLSLMFFPTAWTSIAARLCDVPVHRIYTLSFVSIIASQLAWMLTIRQMSEIIERSYGWMMDNWLISVPVTAFLGMIFWWRFLRNETVSVAKGLFDKRELDSH